MNPWYWLFPVFLVFCCGSFCTFTKNIRESDYYLPIFISLCVASGFMWVCASCQFGKRENAVAEILFFSLMWDLLMIIAYYIGPLLFKGENLTWQSYAAAFLALAGIVWFKIAN